MFFGGFLQLNGNSKVDWNLNVLGLCKLYISRNGNYIVQNGSRGNALGKGIIGNFIQIRDGRLIYYS